MISYKLKTQKFLPLSDFKNTSLNNSKIIEFSLLDYFLPDVFLSKQKKLKYYSLKSKLYSDLDLNKILVKLNQFTQLKQAVMNEDQLVIFERVFGASEISSYEKINNSFLNMKLKENKNSIDLYLLNLIDEEN